MKQVIRINKYRLKAMITESVKSQLNEIDLLPDGIKNTPAKTAWMAISNALVNIQQVMKNIEEEKIPDARSEDNGRVHAIVPKDVEDIVDYIYTTIDNCLSNTLPNLRRP